MISGNSTIRHHQSYSLDCESRCSQSKKLNKALELFSDINRAALDLFLCSFLDRDIVECLPDWSVDISRGHRLLLLVVPDGISTLERMSHHAGGVFYHLGSEQEKVGNGLRELTWNHTTMHMRGVNSDWTYLQMLLPQPEIEAINTLNNKWGEKLLWHLDSVRQHGSQRIAALPFVRL